jgi:hypothetical protein
MANEKNINVTAKLKSANIDLNLKTTSVTVPLIIADANIKPAIANTKTPTRTTSGYAFNISTIALDSIVDNKNINLNLDGLGEESQPDYLIKTNLSDLYQAQELIQFDVEKVLSSSVSTSESLSFGYGPGVLSYFNTSEDVFIEVTFNRVFQDYIAATDDIFGLANIDDDQYVEVGKNTVELVDYNDSFTLEPNKGEIEFVSISETQSFDVFATRGDTLSVNESIIKDFSTNFSDVYLNSESILFTSIFNRDFIENAVPLESIGFNFNKVILDSISVTEDFSYTNVPTQNNSENTSVAETKFAVMQNYFASDYVDPTYTGTTYTI